MLTKEERQAIAGRLRDWDGVDYYDFYRAVTETVTTTGISLGEDCYELSKIILGLCDTSNMVELPLDKDGQVIRVGDTVYDEAKRKLEVDSIRFYQSNVQVAVTMRGEYSNLIYYPSELTHKSPVTAQELSDYMQAVIDTYSSDVSNTAYVKLLDIANQLKELAGKDEE